MSKGARFEIRRGRTGAFRFVLIASNGEVLATSENYTTKAKCQKGIAAVCTCFGTDIKHAGTPTVVDTTVK
jgi:hypothetical protein